MFFVVIVDFIIIFDFVVVVVVVVVVEYFQLLSQADYTAVGAPVFSFPQQQLRRREKKFFQD